MFEVADQHKESRAVTEARGRFSNDDDQIEKLASRRSGPDKHRRMKFHCPKSTPESCHLHEVGDGPSSCAEHRHSLTREVSLT